jgi:hypothetical protein
MAVTIDIGDADDIHHKNKMELGRRLSSCFNDECDENVQNMYYLSQSRYFIVNKASLTIA